MPPRVVADGVTVTVHTPDLAGVGVGWTAGDEEGRVRVVAAQRGQQPRGVARRTIVERQIENLVGGPGTDRGRVPARGVRQPLAHLRRSTALVPVDDPACRRLEVGVDRKCHCWNRGG